MEAARQVAREGVVQRAEERPLLDAPPIDECLHEPLVGARIRGPRDHELALETGARELYKMEELPRDIGIERAHPLEPRARL
jgi:hypothetical protein